MTMRRTVTWKLRSRTCACPPPTCCSAKEAGFEIAQGRLGPGRIHHCMRTIGAAEEALDLMCKRLQSRTAFGKRLSEHSVWEQRVAEARIEIDMYAATLPQGGGPDGQGRQQGRQGRDRDDQGEGAANGAEGHRRRDPGAWRRGCQPGFRSLPASWAGIRTLRLADGPDEVHNRSIARTSCQASADEASPGEGGTSRRGSENWVQPSLE